MRPPAEAYCGRELPKGVRTEVMSFGDGPHRCPGSQVALHETRMFVDALLRVPGVRLARTPTIRWCAPIMGYEVHGAVVERRRQLGPVRGAVSARRRATFTVVATCHPPALRFRLPP